MAVTTALLVQVLGEMENGAIVNDFEDFGLEDPSKGGGCKEYYDMDCMNAPLSARIADNGLIVSLFVSIVLSFIDCCIV